MQHDEKKANYGVPGWIVSTVEVKLNAENALAYNGLRERLCNALGKDDEICNPEFLWNKAFSLLLDHERSLLIKVGKL